MWAGRSAHTRLSFPPCSPPRTLLRTVLIAHCATPPHPPCAPRKLWQELAKVCPDLEGQSLCHAQVGDGPKGEGATAMR